MTEKMPKGGNFFFSDWLRNRNTHEFIGIWEKVYNPDFNYGEFATIRDDYVYKYLGLGVQTLKG